MDDPVTQILSAGQLHDLWGAGFTIVPRRRGDPFEVDSKLVPQGMSYQWNPIIETDPDVVIPDGEWKPVPYARHPGVFGPWGMLGDVAVSNLQLCEKPKAQVDSAHAQAHAKAHKNVEDWLTETGATFSGGVKVGDEVKTVGDKDLARKVLDVVQVDETKTIETTVGIPRDMQSHILTIFKERDRLEAEVVRKDRTLVPGPIADKFYEEVAANERDGSPLQWWPTLRAILLPIAIDNVRLAVKSLEITHPEKFGKESTDE